MDNVIITNVLVLKAGEEVITTLLLSLKPSTVQLEHVHIQLRKKNYHEIFIFFLINSWADIPDRTGFAHREAECSSRGICDRSTGICKCQGNYEGPACERMKCPNMCSGHGQCLSIKHLASYPNAFPLNNNTRYRPTEHQLLLNVTVS